MRFDNDGMQTIVVEGETDYRLFRQWLIERNARIENVDGKSNVKEIWRKAKERRFISIHCIADLDFDLVLKDNQLPFNSTNNPFTSIVVPMMEQEGALLPTLSA
jgi:hypothetical protein